MLPSVITKNLYKKFAKPILFMHDPETAHDFMTITGELLGQSFITRKLIEFTFAYKDENLEKTIDGIRFPNPIGLSAGFNYDGHMASIMSSVGFGFHTVGTVTAKPYGGNKEPRLARLPKSRSLLVNKGFKSKGADKIAEILDKKDLANTVMGISVGSSNLKEVNTIPKAIDDYLYTFDLFKDRGYVKYFELNISCPNTKMPESFQEVKNLKQLIEEVGKLNIKQPVYIKMPNELGIDDTNKLTDMAVKNDLIKGFIFSNLVKDRKNPAFNKAEIAAMKDLSGNFSGKPTEKNSISLIKNARKRYGKDVTIIGVGGVFSPWDAMKKFNSGADLVQLITGMIYEGPQLIGHINKTLANM